MIGMSGKLGEREGIYVSSLQSEKILQPQGRELNTSKRCRLFSPNKILNLDLVDSGHWVAWGKGKGASLYCALCQNLRTGFISSVSVWICQ